ncbi:hypothetical protein ACOMHN_039395 [Nucella lapillus]
MAAEVPAVPVRPHKLTKFAGEEGSLEAEDFIREARLALELQPLGNAAAAGWIPPRVHGRAKYQVDSKGRRKITTGAVMAQLPTQEWPYQQNGNHLNQERAPRPRCLWCSRNGRTEEQCHSKQRHPKEQRQV